MHLKETIILEINANETFKAIGLKVDSILEIAFSRITKITSEIWLAIPNK